ncbi:kinase [Sphingomonas oryzagri]|uniref:Kinase n=1 Tax=Sphingomonas oryzagri TaxID=3042314 RepID=A0ABT6MWY4_9SPHN|nr:kinase [Sphingomonas oryzagri]MDH7637559.1 kinase [Sphingomonas oryzagri]
MSPDLRTIDLAAATIRPALGDSLLLIGLCGAQGSGKSTLAAGLAALFRQESVPSAILSIDDVYHTKAERERLAREIHPLLRTRGVPGTHDLVLGRHVIDDLAAGRSARLPRFDKATDDRAPVSQWEVAPAGTRLLILDGWCVGARPQAAAMLADPVNALEREEDAHGIWRQYVNDQLAGPYQAFFARIDRLILLAAPGFEIVLRWRIEQEEALRREREGGMNDAEIARFIQHYERLTRHILSEMPARADLVIPLAEDRSPRIRG